MNGRVAIVTGAGRGIGRALALELARAGCDVVLCSRTGAELGAVAKEIALSGRKALAVTGDISNEPDVRSLVAAAAKEFGRIDVLINNAGIGTFAPVAELSTADFDAMWGVNLRGTFLATREVLPHMKRQKRGDIVNIASLAGRNAFTGGAGYCATKWALIGFSRCLMLEVRQENIRVITICPGSVDTSFGGPAAQEKSAVIPQAGDIARVAVDALRMPRNVMVSEIDVRPTNPKG